MSPEPALGTPGDGGRLGDEVLRGGAQVLGGWRGPDDGLEPGDRSRLTAPRHVLRTVRLLVGLVLFAVSMAMLVRAGLGNMPWDVLAQGLSHRLGWSFGTVTLVLSGLVLVLWWPLHQRPGVGTVLNVLVIGLALDPLLALLGHLPDPLGLPGAVALVVGGILLNGVASGLYIGARMGPGPRDGLMTGLVGRTGLPIGVVRTSIEVAVVVAGWLLGGTVGFATLAFALAIGPLVHVLLPRLTVPEVLAVRPGPHAGPVPDAPQAPGVPAPARHPVGEPMVERCAAGTEPA
ncbi:membrane protein YczE [Cellulomonas hominis]